MQCSIGILTSSEDSASQNIKRHLIEMFEFESVDKIFDRKPVLRRHYKFISNEALKIDNIEPKLRVPQDFEEKIPIISEKFEGKFELNQEKMEHLQIDSSKNDSKFPMNEEIILTIEILSTEKNKIFLDSNLSTESIKQLNTDYDYLIAASRHKSEAGKPALLVHCPGNFSKAEAGGVDRSLSKSCAVMQHLLFRNMEMFREMENFEFPVDLEVTHHGPTEFQTPLAFIELGSSESEYGNPIGGKIIAKTIIMSSIMLASRPKGSNFGLIIGIGFGGMHYAGNFSRKLSNGFAFSHIVSKYNLEHVDNEIVQKMINRTLESVDFIALDWKSMKSAEKQTLLKILEELTLPILRTTNL